MSLAEEAAQIKQRLEKARAAKERAKGRLDQTMQRLHEEFGVDTLEEAKKLRAKLDEEREGLREEYEAAKAKFNSAWNALKSGFSEGG